MINNKLFFSFGVSLFLLFAFVIPVEIYVKTDKNTQTRIITLNCKLIKRDYTGYNIVTIFDCGNDGILISRNNTIFRKAKEYNKLKVKHYINNLNRLEDEYVILELL